MLLGLYLLGAVSAMVLAALLKRSVLRSQPAVHLELPPYRVPGPNRSSSGLGLGQDVHPQAGTIILTTTAVLWVLLNVPASGPAELAPPQAAAYQMENSVAGKIGTAMEPPSPPLEASTGRSTSQSCPRWRPAGIRLHPGADQRRGE